MVNISIWGCRAAAIVMAATPDTSVMERLDPPRRAAVVMALLALVLTGLLLVTFVMLGANWVRRLARHRPQNRPHSASDDRLARNRRLRESLKDFLPPRKSSADTLHGNAATGETRIDS